MNLHRLFRVIPAASLILPTLLVLALALPAVAEDDPAAPGDADWMVLQQCLEGAREAGGGRFGCIGVVSGPCLEQPGNDSTVMMGACLDKEATMWDDLLNQTYRDLMPVLDPEMQSRLKAAQRSWIMVRDESCELEMAQWGGGTGGGPALIGCLMRETGFRTSQLMDILDMAAGR